MSEISERYRSNAAAFRSRIRSVDAGRWNDPSPCDDWTAIEVVDHVVSTHGMFLGFVGGEIDTDVAAKEAPLEAFDVATAQVQQRLDDDELAAQTFMGFSGETRFDSAVDRFLSLDLVIHGWDLARATGGDDSLDPAEVHRLLTVDVPAFGDMLHSPGVCAAALEVAEDAPEHIRLLAELGRVG